MLSVTLPGAPPSLTSLQLIYTTSTLFRTNSGTITVTNSGTTGNFSATIPADCVFTLVGTASGHEPWGTVPSITSQPQNQTAIAGGSAIFSATAAGSTPLSYQWHFGSSAISGKTNATLTLNSISTNDAGSYSVVVSNSYGTVSSGSATLTVLTSTEVGSGWSLWQAASINNWSQLQLPAVATTGHLLVVFARDFNSGPAGDISIYDMLGNVWSNIAGRVSYTSGGSFSGKGALHVYYCINKATGADTVYINPSSSGSATTVSMNISEWNGSVSDLSSLVDAWASAPDATTTTGPNGLVLANPAWAHYTNDLVLAYAASANAPPLTNTGTGFTAIAPGAYAYGQYKVLNAYGEFSPTITTDHGAGETYGMVCLAFRSATSYGPNTNQPPPPAPTPNIDIGGGWTLLQTNAAQSAHQLSFGTTNKAGSLLLCFSRDYSDDFTGPPHDSASNT